MSDSWNGHEISAASSLSQNCLCSNRDMRIDISSYDRNWSQIHHSVQPHLTEIWSCLKWALFLRKSKIHVCVTCYVSCQHDSSNRPVSQMRAPSGGLSRTSRKLWQDYSSCYIFEHKTQYLLIRAPYTRIVVFWHISNIPPMISQSQISCSTTTFCKAAIFGKYCYTTGSWLL